MNKQILITGATSGMGLSHAIYLSSRGYSVIGTSRQAENINLEELKETYIQNHTKYHYIDKAKTEVRPGKIIVSSKIHKNLDKYLEDIQYISMDVTKTSSVTSAIQNLDNIDVLINNAGLAHFGPIETYSLEAIQDQFEVNFFGYIRVIQAVLPNMRERKKGQIINTSSLAGLTVIPFMGYYSASKAAILRLTESLKIELRPFNIRVSSLLPGDINTPGNVVTAYLYKKGKKFKTTDIKDMIDAIPLEKTSAYYNHGKVAWTTIMQNLIVSPPPIIVSKKIEKIIRAKRPKIHYKCGSKLQTWGVNLMKRFFSENLTIRIMAMFYGL
ncbi:MAG: SDR family oxidoreductase [Promethearchaeota archaeon]